MAESQSPLAGYLPTRCCACGHQFSIRPSIAMQMGINSGHVACPNKDCQEFLHVTALECEAATERWADYVLRETGRPLTPNHKPLTTSP